MDRSGNPDDFVGLQTQPPLRMTHAIRDGRLQMLLTIGAIHGLQKEMLEVQLLELLWHRTGLRKDQLQFRPAGQHQRRAGFRADA